MAHRFSQNDITDYGEKVYKQMHGLFAEGTIPGIRDESADGGFVGTCLDEIYTARLSLAKHYSIPEEDSDMMRIITAYDALLKASAIAMFQHGFHCGTQAEQ